MSNNPLIQDLIENDAFPSVSVALPTGGRWYPENVISAEADPLDLPVGVLGILAEQNYRDPWLLLSGEAIPRMMKGICPDVLLASELCELDLEAILLASRLVSYGPKLELKHVCQNLVPREPEEGEAVEDGEELNGRCGHENTLVLDINEHILRYEVIQDDLAEELFTYRLKRVPQKVNLRPPSYKRVIEQMKESLARNKKIDSMGDMKLDEMVVNEEAIKNYSRIIDMASDTALDNLEASIHSVERSDGKAVDGQEYIREWLLNLPTDEAEGLTEKINEISEWIVSFSDIKYNCEECNGEQTFRLELDANRLFGQAGDSTQPKKPSQKSKQGAKKRRVR